MKLLIENVLNNDLFNFIKNSNNYLNKANNLSEIIFQIIKSDLKHFIEYLLGINLITFDYLKLYNQKDHNILYQIAVQDSKNILKFIKYETDDQFQLNFDLNLLQKLFNYRNEQISFYFEKSKFNFSILTEKEQKEINDHLLSENLFDLQKIFRLKDEKKLILLNNNEGHVYKYSILKIENGFDKQLERQNSSNSKNCQIEIMQQFKAIKLKENKYIINQILNQLKDISIKN